MSKVAAMQLDVRAMSPLRDSLDRIRREDIWRAAGDNKQWPKQELPRSRPDN